MKCQTKRKKKHQKLEGKKYVKRKKSRLLEREVIIFLLYQISFQSTSLLYFWKKYIMRVFFVFLDTL